MQKRIIILILLGMILLLAGSFIAVDWMIFLFGIRTLYAGVAKPVVSFICLMLVLIIGKDGVERRDTVLLTLAFICIVPVDILMSVVVFTPGMTVASPAFMIGGILSIVAHFILLVRHGRRVLAYLRVRKEAGGSFGGVGAFLWLPILVYGIAVAALIPLLKPMIAVGHLGIGLSYSAFVATSTWIAWETVRRKSYPKLNSWLIGVGMSCWLVTEIVGEVYNIKIGPVSYIMFNLVWVFYGTCIVCLALSGYDWKRLCGESESTP
jgi:hypothetical protein